MVVALAVTVAGIAPAVDAELWGSADAVVKKSVVTPCAALSIASAADSNIGSVAVRGDFSVACLCPLVKG